MRKYIKYIVLAIVVIIIALFLLNEYSNGKVKLKSYTYEHENVPVSFDGYRIMLIADIHNAPFEADIIELAKQEDVDAVVFCGDMVQLPDEKTTSVCNIADGMDENVLLYAVSGNHEIQNESYELIMTEMEEHGIKFLENDWEYIDNGSDSIIIAGLKDRGREYVTTQISEKINDRIESFFEDDEDRFKLLINHRADMYPVICNAGADLILSGHLHGGLIRLPFVGGIIGRDDTLFPEYDYGFYEGDEKSDMIVTSGCDQNKIKKRVFNPPEVVVITLKSK